MPKDFNTNHIKNQTGGGGHLSARKSHEQNLRELIAAADSRESAKAAAEVAAAQAAAAAGIRVLTADARRPDKPLALGLYNDANKWRVAAFIFFKEFCEFANTAIDPVVTSKPRRGDPSFAELEILVNGKLCREFTCRCGGVVTAARYRGVWAAHCWARKRKDGKRPKGYTWLNLMSWNRCGSPALRHDKDDSLQADYDRECLVNRTKWHIAEMRPAAPVEILVLKNPGDDRQGKLLTGDAPPPPRDGDSRRVRMLWEVEANGDINYIATALLILAGHIGGKAVPDTPAALGRYLLDNGLKAVSEYARGDIARRLIKIGAVAWVNRPSIALGRDARAMKFLKEFAGMTKRMGDLIKGFYAALVHTTGKQGSFDYNPKERMPLTSAYRKRNFRRIFESIGAVFITKKSTPAYPGRGNYWQITLPSNF